jgi:2-polyprenyl-3-methyl-5-hydroxy-6-metoxy-1,4-benzoquinol methylase
MEGQFLHLVKCQHCGLVYQNLQKQQKELKGVYNEAYFKSSNSIRMGYDDYLQDKENIERTSSKRLDFIERIIRPSTLLDVGCAYGFFMNIANQRGWRSKGIDIAYPACQYARDSLGLDVLCSDIQTAPLEEYSFGLITLWDVIEHLSNPRQVLGKLHKLLKKRGRLIFTTPDVRSIPARIARHRWIGFKSRDEHLWYFSRQTISRLIESSGFKVERIFYVGKFVKPGMFIDRLSNYLPAMAGLLSCFHNKKSSFYFNPLDIMCVISRKV